MINDQVATITIYVATCQMHSVGRHPDLGGHGGVLDDQLDHGGHDSDLPLSLQVGVNHIKVIFHSALHNFNTVCSLLDFINVILLSLISIKHPAKTRTLQLQHPSSNL